MKKLLISISLLFPILLQAQTVCSLESREKVESALEKLTELDSKSMTPNERIVEIGQWFMGTPYVEKTLEIPGPEQVVIDFQGVDCTTFLESVVSLALIEEAGDLSFEAFEKELENLRYRGGKNTGYISRLHYFSDWIYSNQKKGIVTDMTQKIGGVPYENHPTFMTENPQLYPQLSQKENVEQLKNIEAGIRTRSYYFIPKAQISQVENKIQSGDLIAITTSMNNLDMVHVGFAFEKDGRIHLMHASSKNKEVEISELPLHEYLAGNRSQSGIMVVRLNSASN
ncbi:N-acetylmuramoyl-L-alanine amidase-like domain-containing protein [Algoriphagus sp. PAP.12]|uniref:N-acetylmuramoyl-L-alanine amidase-like domain-containing protein n=1 Tax=Algoriphagus sp. PAP.12 TaxID=2996678 RepID=UPI00227B887F|nr:N-acetylmuramoyl-L-alanine amidase-like domain-containing protein [Algoriphagus sp. PAP.12]